MDQRRLGPFMVAPIGFGAMRLTGPNVFGPPDSRSDAIALLRAAVDGGVDHIDTAQYYGPDIVNELICEALHPYPPELALVSKVGARRDDRGGIFGADEPAELRRGIEDNLRALRIDRLAVVNLRLMRDNGSDAFFDDQLAAMVSARDDGLIAAIGLSNVTLAHVLHALQFTELACVQNAFHLTNRRSQSVLDECARRNIAFVPFSPLGSGRGGRRPLDSRSRRNRDAVALHARAGRAGVGTHVFERVAHPGHIVRTPPAREPGRVGRATR